MSVIVFICALRDSITSPEISILPVAPAVAPDSSTYLSQTRSSDARDAIYNSGSRPFCLMPSNITATSPRDGACAAIIIFFPDV